MPSLSELSKTVMAWPDGVLSITARRPRDKLHFVRLCASFGGNTQNGIGYLGHLYYLEVYREIYLSEN